MLWPFLPKGIMRLYIIYMCESIDILLFLKNFIFRVIQEIICTPSHLIYIEGKGLKQVVSLKVMKYYLKN